MPITGDGRLAFHTIATLLPQIGFLIIEFAVFLIDDVLDELHRRLCSDQEPVAVPIQIDELLLIRITAMSVHILRRSSSVLMSEMLPA